MMGEIRKTGLAIDPAVLCLGRRSLEVHGLADQAPDQSGPQGFLSCPEEVCPCGFGFSAGASLSGGAGMGFIGRKSLRCRFTDVAVCASSEKI